MFKEKDITFKIGFQFSVLAVAFLLTISLAIAAIKNASDSAYELCDSYTELSQKTDEKGNLYNIQKEYKKSAAKQKALLTSVLIFTIIDGALIYVAFKYSVKDISMPMAELKEATTELAKGNFAIRIDCETDGEIGDLAENLRKVTQNLGDYVSDISRCMDDMAKGNLNVGLNEEFKGEFASIKNSTDNIINVFNGVLDDLVLCARNITECCEQVLIANQKVSENYKEHIQSVGAFSAASLENMNMMKQLSDKVRYAQGDVEKLENSAKEHQKNIDELIDSIKEINANADAVDKVLKVINDISEQINLISINAAVEAFKTEGNGSDFAVVADEIRSLAVRTGKATNNIKEIIDKTNQSIDESIKVADSLKQNSKNVFENINAVNEKINDVSISSKQQLEKYNDLKTEMKTIATDIQSANNDAFESVKAGRNLEVQTVNMNNLILGFKNKR
ncbi:MAG: HAMP domain-containing protein [Clostridiales bacterium]|nr:HAMP domain-containing protein [Clostridiales bacterium]